MSQRQRADNLICVIVKNELRSVSNSSVQLLTMSLVITLLRIPLNFNFKKTCFNRNFCHPQLIKQHDRHCLLNEDDISFCRNICYKLKRLFVFFKFSWPICYNQGLLWECYDEIHDQLQDSRMKNWHQFVKLKLCCKSSRKDHLEEMVCEAHRRLTKIWEEFDVTCHMNLEIPRKF